MDRCKKAYPTCLQMIMFFGNAGDHIHYHHKNIL